MQINKRKAMSAVANVLTSNSIARRDIAMEQKSFDGSRDYFSTLGYEKKPEFEYYYRRYLRGVGKVVVDLPATDTWKKPPRITIDDKTDNEFVQTWNGLVNRLRVWNKLMRADILSGIYQYGVLLLGVNDGKDISEAVDKISPEDLLYLTPLSQSTVRIKSFVSDTGNKRYNLPEIYEIKLGIGEDADYEEVHWTRVLHIAEGKLDSEVFGTPRMESSLNALDDLTKVVGGASEAAWQTSKQGVILRPQADYDLSDIDSEDVYDEVESFVHDITNIIWAAGVESETFNQGADIKLGEKFDALISYISATSRIPKRKLLGSSQGQLSASTEDSRQWAGEVSGRQKRYAEPEILRPFIDRLISLGVLPSAEYSVGTTTDKGERVWPSILEVTEDEEADIRLKNSKAMKNFETLTRLTDVNEIRSWFDLEELSGQDMIKAQASANSVIGAMFRAYRGGDLTVEEYHGGVLEVVSGILQ